MTTGNITEHFNDFTQGDVWLFQCVLSPCVMEVKKIRNARIKEGLRSSSHVLHLVSMRFSG